MWLPSAPGSVHEAVQHDVQVHSLALVCQLCDSGPHIVPREAHVANVVNHLHSPSIFTNRICVASLR